MYRQRIYDMKHYTSQEQISQVRTVNRQATTTRNEVKIPKLSIIAWTLPLIIVAALHLMTGVEMQMEFILSAIIIGALFFIGYRQPEQKKKNTWNK